MEDIEYLEEYEDLVLPALNSAAAAAASSTSTSITKTNTVTEFVPKSSANDDGDGSSSSLDQDIFNCLFDDHSDDDNDYTVERLDDNTSLNEKRESSASLDSLDLLVDDLGEQVAKEVELQKAQEESNNKIIISNPKAKETPKATPSTTKPKTFATNSSVVPTVSLNTNRNTTATQQNRNLTINKQKSVATVRPTVQNKQQQRQNTNLIQRSSFIQQQQRPTSSTATTSSASFSSVRPTTSRSVQLPVLARKPLSSTLSSSGSSAAASSTLVGNKFKPNPAIKPTIIQRPATIVKPERIITRDPAEDPLNLDDLSEEASDSDSVSDISGETYNSISDFYEDDDEDDYSGDNDEYYEEELEDDDISNNSQIIELSNDSSGSTLNLEDLRAATPSPVISQDQDLPSSSFGFNKRKTRSTHLLRNRDILQGLLTRGEKPKLLELINQYAHTNNSVSEEEDEVGEVIDITGSRENLIENISGTKVTILSDTIITPISATTTKQENKLSTTNRTITPTHSAKDKSKTVKISIRAMENIKPSGRDLRSPGAASDDSYLSAVEELLEESYAEAMKKMNDSDDPSAVDELLEESYAEAMKKLKEKSALQNQGVGADIKVEEKLEVVGEQETEVKCEPEKDKPKTSKIGIVIEYEDNSLDQEIKEEESKIEIKTTENKQNVAETEKVKEMETKQNDKKDDLTKDKVFTDNPLVKIQQSSSKLENVSKDQPAETSNTENKTGTTPSDSIKSPINESPNTRKKKRFRNLISPETTENTVLQITEETVIDGDDFKGFEEVDIKKTESAQVNVEKDQTHQKDDKTEKLKLSSCGSFKSPTKTHKSLMEKSKDKSSRDSSPSKTSKTSSDRSRDSSPSKTPRSSADKSKDTKSKSSRDNSKDSKSSRDSSRESKDKHHKDISKDKSSRESKDRSRESSKDSSKHSKTEIKSIDDKSPHKHTTETSSKHTTETSSKHTTETSSKHHKDHRKSRDSKDSSKSRESSKSRDNKESKEKKSETKDSHRSTSIEKKSDVKKDNKSVHISRDKTDKDTSKDVKVSKEKEINKKQTEESKDKKIVDKIKDSKDIKSATEKVIDVSKNKEIDNKKKPQSTSKTSTPSSSGKSLVSPAKVLKPSADLKEAKDKKELPSSRDSSKDRKDVSKTKDTTSAESDKKSKEIKKSETSSRESSKDRKDIKNTQVVKNINKIHADQQSPKTNPKDLNKSSTSQDIKNTNETSSFKDLKSAEHLKELKSSHDNKIVIKSKESSKETKKDLNDNKTKQKSSNLKDSTSTSNSSKSTKDVFENLKNEKNTTSIDVSKNQDLNDSFEMIEKKKETKTKSEKPKSNETTDNKPKAKESESAIKKTEKIENISENKTVLNKDPKEIKTRSDKIILGMPVIKLTRIEDIKPKFGQKIAENKTTKNDNTNKEESKSKESKEKAKIDDLKLNKTEKDTGESKELVTEKKDGEPKCDIVAKKTETRKIKIKRGSIKSTEFKAQDNKDSKSKVINSEKETEITQEKEKNKSQDTKCVTDKIVEESQADASVHEKNEEKSDPIKTRKSMGSKSEAKASKDDQQNLGTPQDESAELKPQKETSGHDKNEENSNTIKTRKTLNSKSEDAKVSRDKEIKLKGEENKDKFADLKSQEETSINEDKLEPMITRKSLVLKTEEPKSIETATATEKGGVEVKDTLEESITKPLKTRKSFELKPEKLTSSKVAVTDETTKDKSVESKLEPRKTRNRHDSKTEDQIPKETSDSSDKKGEDSKSGTKPENTSDLVEKLQPEPRITRNRQEEHKSKETGGNPEKKVDHSKSETTSENPNDKSGENKTEPSKTRNRHDSKTEEHKSEEIVGITEKSVEETKRETKSVKITNLMETSDDKSEDIKPETRKTRNQHDSKTEEEKSKEMIDKSVNVAENPKTESEENKLEKRKTRNRQDPKAGEKKSEETVVNADKKFEEPLEEAKESVDKTMEESVESKPEPRITRNRNDTKIKEQKSAEISDNAEKEVDEHKTEPKSEKTAGLPDKAEEVSLENKPETRITRNRHDTKIEEQKPTEISGNAEQKVEQHKTEPKSEKTAGLADKVKEVVLENKPEPRITRNNHDTKIDKQKPTEISGNADQTLEEKKSETKPEKSVGLADKSEEVSLENKPEPRITRNRQDTKIEEPKSTETSYNAEQMVEEKIESSVEKTADKDEETLLENKPEPRITRNRRDSKTEEQKSAEGKNNEEKKLEEIETSVEKSADVKNEMVERKAELRKIRSRHDLKTEEEQQISVNADKTDEQNSAETIDNAKEIVQENVKDESLEHKPETRKTRNRHDSNTEEQQLKETSSNVEQQLQENKNKTKSEKTAGLVDKVIDESFENKPETRKTRNRNVLKTDEQKSEEISGNAEKKSEETKIEKTAVLAEIAKEESLENKPEPRKTRLADKKVEETKNENKSLKTVDITEKTTKSEASKPEMEKTSVFTETAKDESLENKPEPRKTRNADKKIEETKNENKSLKTVNIAEKTAKSEASKPEVEKTSVLEETAKDESLENKPEPRKTRNADKKVEETKNENKSLKTVDISEKTTDKSEASKPEMEKTAILGEIAKDESLENKPEPRKTRNADKKAEETKIENKSLKTVDIAERTTDESEANKPEIEKTTVLEEIAKESLEKKPEPRKTRNADKKVEETKNENKSLKTVDIAEKTTDNSQENKPAILGEIPKDESLENKPEPRKTRNADKKVEETKNENKSLKTVDISEKTTDKSEENELEPRRTRNRYDSKTEDHNTSDNFDKKLEETKSRATTPNKIASLMKKTKVESAENKAEPRKTRSLYDLKSEELKSVETSQNVEETVELTNIETVENAASVKSDEAGNKDSVTTVENIAEGEKERNQEAVKLEEAKTIVKENEEKLTVENQTEELITSQIEPDIDNILNTENNTSAEKNIDFKEPNTSSSETSSNEKLENENITESKTGSEKDKNETSSRVETSTSIPTEGDLIKDNISIVSDSSSIITTTSISSSDTPTRRTLRKRGTESPFPENDNTKKIFKEPPAKSTMGTPKMAKNEKTSTDFVSPSSTTSKRNLRSPCPDADTTLNVSKKPRLESPGRKSARFRHFNEDCLEEVELPVLTAAAVNDFTTNKEIVSDPAPEVSQSPRKSIRREISQDKNLEHVQEPTDKKQDKKESTKTFDVLDPLNIEQTPKKLLQEEVLNIETIKEKQENLSATKSSVSAKKKIRTEEVKTPKGNKKADDKVKLDSAEPVETKIPLKKLHRGEVVDIETLETNPTESVDTSSQILEHEDLSNAKPNINVKKSLRSEDAKIIQTPMAETKIDSAIKNKSASKSPGAVLTFSDWLKNKNQTSVTQPENIPILQQTATGETAKVEPKRKSRMKKKKLAIRTVENTKANVEKVESTDNPNNNTQEETALPVEKEDAEKSTSLSNILENTSTMEKQSPLVDSMEITQTSLDDDNSLLQPSLIQITEREVPKKHGGRPFKKLKPGANSLKRSVPHTKKKPAIEKPQEIQQVSQDNITLNETINEENNKSNSSLDKSNPTPKQKSKRTERDLLIESMSKEMKEGGIQDLLNFDKHVKRQRSASRKKLTSSTEQLNTSTTETAEAGISSDVSLVKESPKIIEFSDMPDVAAEMPILIKENIKSPTKKKAATQQNVKKSKKSLPGLYTPINAVIDDDDGLSTEVTATFVTQDVAPATTSKPLTVEANTEAVIIRKKTGRKSAIQKEKEISKLPTSTQNISAEPILLAEAVLTKSRKSLKTKDTTNESMTTATIRSKDVTTALPVVIKSRKSLGSTKQQPIKEAQVDLNKSNRFVNKVDADIFKAPKLITQSTILNKIPTVENIKQLYADTNKRPQSRNLEKFKQSKILSSTFKCRKLRVRLNRSVVKRYWKSLKQRNLINPVLFSAASSQNVRANLHTTNAIRHNKETNLRIKSVVSTVNVVNEPIESLSGESVITQDSVSQELVPRNTLPSNVDNPPYFVPTSSTLDSDVPLELKYEFVEENPKNMENSILPDTPTLLARAQTITQAAQHALSKSITPTDIRLVTTESSSHAYVSSFGVAPTALNNKGTCLYTFLHPAKYNRNHSNVLLDFCCPNLDGPMPAIDPTRIHAQVQTPVIELPACIVLTTKVVTRAELENKNSSIPAIIRKKAERIRSNIAAHHNIASAAATAATQSAIMTQPHIPHPPRLQPQIPQSQLSSTMNALAKHLPPTTTITPKIRPAQPQPSVVHPPPTVSVTAKGQPGVGNRITNYVQPLRSNLRRFDVLQKQLCQPFDRLTFVDRHRIIESIITSGKLSPTDLERTLILMEEYLTQISLLKSQSQTKHVYAVPEQNSPTTLPSLNQMPQLQPAPNIIASASSSSSYAIASKQLEQLQNKSIRKIQTSTSRNTNLSPNRGTGEMEQRHVPIYDTDRNIIGYQLQPMSAKPAYTKSTMSSRTSGGIMSTSLENQITSYSISKRPIKRPAQDSPRVFYTTPPQHTSTPIATNPHVYNTNSSSSKALSQKTHQHKGSIVTTVRSSGGSNQSGGSETITTTTMATVKRVTRSTATGSKIIIVSKSNQSSEETILPDIGSNEAETAEIKNETDMEDFVG